MAASTHIPMFRVAEARDFSAADPPPSHQSTWGWPRRSVFSLLKLPTELILHILSFVDAESAEILQQFPSIHRLHPRLLDTHVKPFESITIMNGPSAGSGTVYSCPLALIEHLRRDAGLMRYIRRLSMPGRVVDAEVWNPGDLRRIPTTRDTETRRWAFERMFGDDHMAFCEQFYRELDAQSGLGCPATISAWSHIKHPDPLNGFHDRLLVAAHLPSLERLRICVPRGALWGMLLLERLLRTCGRWSISFVPSPVFHHLRFLNLLIDIHPRGHPLHIQEIRELFSTLSSLVCIMTLHTVVLDGDGEAIEASAPGTPPDAFYSNSNVRCLEMYGCNFRLTHLSLLLWLFPNLTELSVERCERASAAPRDLAGHSAPHAHWEHPTLALLPFFRNDGRVQVGSQGLHMYPTLPARLRALRLRFEHATGDDFAQPHIRHTVRWHRCAMASMFRELAHLHELEVSATAFCVPGMGGGGGGGSGDDTIALAASLPPGLAVLKLHRVHDLGMAVELFEGLGALVRGGGGDGALGRVIFSARCPAAAEYIIRTCKDLKLAVREVPQGPVPVATGPYQWL